MFAKFHVYYDFNHLLFSIKNTRYLKNRYTMNYSQNGGSYKSAE